MTEWQFWGDRQILSVYENIYLRTFVEDWFKIVEKVASEIKGNSILDLGCGEGHTTKQILDRINRKYDCDLLEPNKDALNSAKKFLSFENKIGKSFNSTLNKFHNSKKYDTVFTSHTNYYWAKTEEEFKKQLDKFMSLVKNGGRGLILTLPEESDHYKVMLKQVYPKFNYSEFIIKHYRTKGFKVKVVKFKMRMFIEDILTNNNTYDLKNFYKFIHNTPKFPTDLEAEKFLKKIKKFEKKGYLDFKDELIIIEK